VSELGTRICEGPVTSRRCSGEFGLGTFRATVGRVSLSTNSSSAKIDALPGGYDDSGAVIILCAGVGGAMLEVG